MSPDIQRKPVAGHLSYDSAWFEALSDEDLEPDNEFDAVPGAAAVSTTWSLEYMCDLAERYVDKTAPLLDRSAGPVDVDEEQCVSEQDRYFPLTVQEKRELLAEIFAHELTYEDPERPAERVQDDPLIYLGQALYYRQMLLSPSIGIHDKREILKRIYTREPHEWLDDEIVGLHFILLDELKYLARPSANMERRSDLLRWFYTDDYLEDRPFSAKNCVLLATGNRPMQASVYRALQDELRLLNHAWIYSAIQKKSKSGQMDLFFNS